MSAYRLKKKFFLAYLLAILPFILLIFFFFDNWLDQRRQTFLQKNLQIAVTISSLTERYLDTALIITQTLADDFNIKELKVNEAKLLFARTLLKIPFTIDFLLTDKSGNVLTTTNTNSPTTPLSLKDQDFFQKLANTKKPVVSVVGNSHISQIPSVAVASPVFSKEGEYIGAVILNTSLDILRSDIERTSGIEKSTQAFLLDQNGEIILKTGENKITNQDRQSFKNTSLLKDILKRKETVLENYKNRLLPKPVNGITTPIHKYDWTVIITGSLDKQVEPIIQLQKTFLITAILALIYAILLITYFIRKFLPFT